MLLPDRMACTFDKKCKRTLAKITDAAEFCDRCNNLVVCEPAAPVVDVQVHTDLEARLLGQVATTPEDEAELKKYFAGCTYILDPVARIDQLLIEAKAAPRFRDDTYDAIDRLDATMFSGDEFMACRDVRHHFRYYLARWEKQLREYDAFDNAMEGEKG